MTQCNQCYVISTFFINFNTSSAACPQSHQSPYWLCLSNVDPGRSDPSGNTKYKYSYKYIMYNIQIEIWSPFRLVLLIMSVICILCLFLYFYRTQVYLGSDLCVMRYSIPTDDANWTISGYLQVIPLGGQTYN